MTDTTSTTPTTIRLRGSARRAAEYLFDNTSLSTSGLPNSPDVWTAHNDPETNTLTLTIDFDAPWSRGERTLLNLIAAFGQPPDPDGVPGGPMFLAQLFDVDGVTRWVAHEAIGIFAEVKPPDPFEDLAPCCATKPQRGVLRSYMCTLPQGHGGAHIATASGRVLDTWIDLAVARV